MLTKRLMWRKWLSNILTSQVSFVAEPQWTEGHLCITRKRSYYVEINNNNNSVEKSHWESNSASAGEQNSHLVCNLEFHYRNYKCPPLEFTLNLLCRIQNLTLLGSILSIIVPAVPAFSKPSLPSRFFDQNIILIFSLAIYATCPAHPILLQHIWWRVQQLQ